MYLFFNVTISLRRCTKNEACFKVTLNILHGNHQVLFSNVTNVFFCFELSHDNCFLYAFIKLLTLSAIFKNVFSVISEIHFPFQSTLYTVLQCIRLIVHYYYYRNSVCIQYTLYTVCIPGIYPECDYTLCIQCYCLVSTRLTVHCSQTPFHHL